MVRCWFRVGTFESRPDSRTSHLEAQASIMPSMTTVVRIGTREGLWWLERDQAFPVEPLAGKSLTALAPDRDRVWALVEGGALWEGVQSDWRERATIDGLQATCLA